MCVPGTYRKKKIVSAITCTCGRMTQNTKVTMTSVPKMKGDGER